MVSFQYSEKPKRKILSFQKRSKISASVCLDSLLMCLYLSICRSQTKIRYTEYDNEKNMIEIDQNVFLSIFLIFSLHT